MSPDSMRPRALTTASGLHYHTNFWENPFLSNILYSTL